MQSWQAPGKRDQHEGPSERKRQTEREGERAIITYRYIDHHYGLGFRDSGDHYCIEAAKIPPPFPKCTESELGTSSEGVVAWCQMGRCLGVRLWVLRFFLA